MCEVAGIARSAVDQHQIGTSAQDHRMNAVALHGQKPPLGGKGGLGPAFMPFGTQMRQAMRQTKQAQ